MALSTGVSHRALIPIAGKPMVVRVIETLRSAGVERITISVDDPAVLADLEGLRDLVQASVVQLRASQASPAASVAEFLRAGGSDAVLVTTADHPLLTPEMISHFWREAVTAGADVAVGVVTERVFRARYPTLERTFVRLADEGFSGANLFRLHGPAAAAVAEFWQKAEGYRKKPWRLIAMFGWRALLAFARGRLSAPAALALVSRAVGAHVMLVRLPFAESAIDVDRASDLALAREILNAGTPC